MLQRRSDLRHRGHGSEAVKAGGSGDLTDGEREATRHGDLVRLGSCTHTPYLARHCRRKLVGSLPWGIPTVVNCQQSGTQATNFMVTQDTNKDFIQVRPPWGRNTYILRLIVLIWDIMRSLTCPLGDPCPFLYIVKGQSYKYSIWYNIFL